MKQITIGEKRYDLMETMFDINDERFHIFKQWLLQIFEKVNEPLFLTTYTKYIQNFNSGNHADGLLEWVNYKKAISLKQLNYDAYTYCFALICLEEGEKQNDISDITHERKIKEMREAGLSRGVVEQAVENFIKASGTILGVYAQMLELMKTPLREEFLNE